MQKQIFELLLEKNQITEEALKPELQALRYKEIFAPLLTAKNILVIHDTDADGLCSARIWREYLGTPKMRFHPLLREDRNISSLIENMSNTSIIVCLDCGSGFDWSKCKSQIYVIDHHEINTVYQNVNYINPKNDFPSTTYCTSSLLYHLFEMHLGYNGIAIQYAAIGAVADMMPMLSDNRDVARRGIARMNRTPCDFVEMFQPYNSSQYDETHIGFTIAPTINAPSRMLKTEIAIDAVVWDDENSLSQLKKLNEQRKTLVKTILETSDIAIYDKSIICTIDIDANIAGLVANKLMFQYQKPVMCYNVRSKSASFRSPINVSVEKFIHDCKLDGGGHFSAAGAKIDNLYITSGLFIEYCNTFDNFVFDSPIEDIYVNGNEFLALCENAKDYKPYGQGFRPLLVLCDMTIAKIGRTYDIYSVESGYQAFSLQSGKYAFKAICYNVPMKLEIGKQYLFTLEHDGLNILIKDVKNAN